MGMKEIRGWQEHLIVSSGMSSSD